MDPLAAHRVDYDAYYDALFRPITEQLGSLDTHTMMAIVGFDAGGPVSLSTIGFGRDEYPTFITCELSVRDDQVDDECPPFELMMTCNSEDFARQTLTAIGDLSLSAGLGDGHLVTLDDDLAAPGVAGVVLEEAARVNIDGAERAVLRVIGIDEKGLDLAKRKGVEYVLETLRRDGSYPRTHVRS